MHAWAHGQTGLSTQSARVAEGCAVICMLQVRAAIDWIGMFALPQTGQHVHRHVHINGAMSPCRNRAQAFPDAALPRVGVQAVSAAALSARRELTFQMCTHSLGLQVLRTGCLSSCRRRRQCNASYCMYGAACAAYSSTCTSASGMHMQHTPYVNGLFTREPNGTSACSANEVALC